MTNKVSYTKEVKRAIKSDGKVIGWNIVHISYDKNDVKVGERIVHFVPKKDVYNRNGIQWI